MPIAATPVAVLAALAGCLAAIFDFRFRRIPNWLCAAAFCLGLAMNTWLKGMEGARSAALGTGLAVAIYLPLYLARAVGGGDLKFMAALGAIAGPSVWLAIFLITSLGSGVAAIALGLMKGRLRRTLSNVAFIFAELLHLRRPHLGRPELNVTHPDAVRLPHGVVIGGAIGLYLIACAGA